MASPKPDGQLGQIVEVMLGTSAHIGGLLADQLTRTLGLTWEARDRGPDRSLAWEITGVSQKLMDESVPEPGTSRLRSTSHRRIRRPARQATHRNGCPETPHPSNPHHQTREGDLLPG